MPGNNWDPGGATFSGCSSGVERVPWAHEVAGAIPVIPTRNTGIREPVPAIVHDCRGNDETQSCFQLGV